MNDVKTFLFQPKPIIKSEDTLSHSDHSWLMTKFRDKYKESGAIQ